MLFFMYLYYYAKHVDLGYHGNVNQRVVLSYIKKKKKSIEQYLR